MKKLYKNNISCIGPVSNTSTPQKKNEHQEPISKSSRATSAIRGTPAPIQPRPHGTPINPTSHVNNAESTYRISDNLRLHMVVIVLSLSVGFRRLVLPVLYSIVDIVRLGTRRTTRRRFVAGSGAGRTPFAGTAARTTFVTRWRPSLLLPLR